MGFNPGSDVGSGQGCAKRIMKFMTYQSSLTLLPLSQPCRLPMLVEISLRYIVCIVQIKSQGQISCSCLGGHSTLAAASGAMQQVTLPRGV